MIDPQEFKNYLLLIKRACDLAAEKIDNGDSAGAEDNLRRIERLLRAARTFSGSIIA